MGLLRRRRPARSVCPAGLHLGEFGNWVRSHPDSYGAVVSLTHNGDWRYRMPVGVSAGGWRHTDSQTSMLTLAPPRSAAGKTASIMIPTVLCAGGPVVSYSTKWDVAIASAMARGRLGTVWAFDPTGAPPPPGFRQLRWSPVPAARHYSTALEIAGKMVRAASAAADGQGDGGRRNDAHWTNRAAQLIGAVLHYAALTGRDLGWAVDAVTAQDIKGRLGPAHDELRAMGAVEAADMLRGCILAGGEEQQNVFATATGVLNAYRGTSRRSAVDVNFDPEAFVRGEPTEPSDLHVEDTNPRTSMLANLGIHPRLPGRYDTVYIVVPADRQDLYAPAVIGLIAAIQRAAYDQHAKGEWNRGSGRKMPVTLALDEMYGAPLPFLPKLLADGGSQGVLICGALQDLSQAVERWGVVGEGMAGLFQNVVVGPGIRHRPTLELLSMLVGMGDRVVVTQSQSETFRPDTFLGFRGTAWLQSESQHFSREPILPPDAIYRGNRARPRECLVFTPNGGWQHVELMPYWAGSFWPLILMHSAELALQGRSDRWNLPLPDLAKDGDYSALAAIAPQAVEWYRELERQWTEVQHAPALPTPVIINGESFTTTDYVGRHRKDDAS